jgi:hypothetical protein
LLVLLLLLLLVLLLVLLLLVRLLPPLLFFSGSCRFFFCIRELLVQVFELTALSFLMTKKRLFTSLSGASADLRDFRLEEFFLSRREARAEFADDLCLSARQLRLHHL